MATTDEVDYDIEDDEVDNDMIKEDGNSTEPQLKIKGRGHKVTKDDNHDDDMDNDGRGGIYETDTGENHGRENGHTTSNSNIVGTCKPAKSVEGYNLFIRNIHDEAAEDDIIDKFSEYGDVKALHLNLDRRTGFVKGYAILEFEDFTEAETAIKELDGTDLLGEKISVDWGFKMVTGNDGNGNGKSRRGSA